MKIRNKQKKANYVNYKINGMALKVLISSGNVVEIPALTSVNQILNYGDFTRGFFEIIEKTEEVQEPKEEEKETEDTLEKVEKEVRDYTDNEE